MSSMTLWCDRHWGFVILGYIDSYNILMTSSMFVNICYIYVKVWLIDLYKIVYSLTGCWTVMESAIGGPLWCKTVTNTGPKEAFRCLDLWVVTSYIFIFTISLMIRFTLLLPIVVNKFISTFTIFCHLILSIPLEFQFDFYIY